jgi:Protein of unknown function (DUF3300)
VFMASTYPLEIVQAARWLRENPKLQGSQRDEALKKQSWDDSVKSLATFPEVLNMMNDKLDWTQKLGDAFLAQQKDVMDAVQRLRAKAHAEGNLKSTNEQKVSVEQASAAAAPVAPAPAGQPAPAAPTPPATTVITIEPTNPQVVYVPTYNPTVVYGAWPYPAYPPYAYYPPGYAAATFATAAISFGVGMAVGSALWGGCNWGRGDVDINVNRYNNFTSNVNVENARNKLTARSTNVGGDRQWSHDPDHRRGTQYRDRATQQRFGKGEQAGLQSREAFRGRAEQGRQEIQRGGADQFRQGGRSDRSGPGQQPGRGSVGEHGGKARQTGGGLADRPGHGQHPGGGLADRGGSLGDGGGHGGGAFQGIGNGAQARDFGNRGHTSISQARGGAGGSFHGGGGGGGGFHGGGGGGRGGGGGHGGGRRR